MKDYYERMTPEQARAFKDDMTAELVMSLLIIRDAAKAPELFEKSANVYVRMAEEDVCGKAAYIKNFRVEDLESFKAAENTEA